MISRKSATIENGLSTYVRYGTHHPRPGAHTAVFYFKSCWNFWNLDDGGYLGAGLNSVRSLNQKTSPIGFMALSLSIRLSCGVEQNKKRNWNWRNRRSWAAFFSRAESDQIGPSQAESDRIGPSRTKSDEVGPIEKKVAIDMQIKQKAASFALLKKKTSDRVGLSPAESDRVGPNRTYESDRVGRSRKSVQV